MATTDTTDRATFPKSNTNYRDRNKDQAGRGTGTRGIRRVFETDGGGGDSTTASSRTTTTGIHSSGGATSRYRDRTESPSSGARATSSITNKINKLTLSDDRADDEQLVDDEAETRSRRVEDDDADNEENRGNEAETTTRRPIKKTGPRDGKKRKDKRHLREKRRSTGVVIMPGQPANENDEEAKTVQRNTASNMDDSAAAGATAAGVDVSSYEQTISELQDQLAARHKELDSLRTQVDQLKSSNLRLKDENSALLRVVGSLSGTGGAR